MKSLGFEVDFYPPTFVETLILLSKDDKQHQANLSMARIHL